MPQHGPQNCGGLPRSARSASFNQSAASHPSLSCSLVARAAIWRHSSAFLRNISASVSVMTGRTMRKNQLAQFSNMVGPRRVPTDAQQTAQLFELACAGEDLIGAFAGPVRPLPIQPIGELLIFRCHPLQFVARAGGGRKHGLLPAQKLKRTIGEIGRTMHPHSIQPCRPREHSTWLQSEHICVATRGCERDNSDNRAAPLVKSPQQCILSLVRSAAVPC